MAIRSLGGPTGMNQARFSLAAMMVCLAEAMRCSRPDFALRAASAACFPVRQISVMKWKANTWRPQQQQQQQCSQLLHDHDSITAAGAILQGTLLQGI